MVKVCNFSLTNCIFSDVVSVAMIGMNAAIDNKNNGAGATKDMQTGYSDSTTKQYGAKVGNSLLFGGNVNTNTGSISNNSVNIDSSTSISSSNLNQTAKNNESANYQHEHKNITTDVGKIMTDIAINVAVAVGAEVLGPLLESGVSKLGSFVSKSFGFTDEATEFAATTMTKDEIIQAGMNNITAEKPIAKAINNLSSTPEKALNSVDNTVDILGELGKKALPDPMNGMSKIVDKAMPDMSLAKDVGSLGKNVGSVLDAGVAKPAYLHVPGLSGKIGYFLDDPAVVSGSVIGGSLGIVADTTLKTAPLFQILGTAGGGYVSKAIINNIAREAVTAPTLESIKNVNILLNLK